MRKGWILAGAGVLALAAAATAFEGTSWHGDLVVKTMAKVKKGTTGKDTTTDTGGSLTTGTTDFALGTTGGGTMPGLMEKRNDRNYRASADPENAAFLQWVHDQVLAQTGVDVEVAGASLKGKFVLDKEFGTVKLVHQIKYFGVVASGEDVGKAVKGKIKVKGALPRDT